MGLVYVLPFVYIGVMACGVLVMIGRLYKI